MPRMNGAPLRTVVDTGTAYSGLRVWVYERLSCGHDHVYAPPPQSRKRRRCWQCRAVLAAPRTREGSDGKATD